MSSAAPAIPAPRPLVRANPNALLAVVAVAQFMVILDSTVVNVALPTIRNDLGFSEQSLSWVLNAYTLIFGGFLLLGGRLADSLGRRRLFMTGIALFAGASLLCGVSQSEGMLLVARGTARVSPGDTLDPVRALGRGVAKVTDLFSDMTMCCTGCGACE